MTPPASGPAWGWLPRHDRLRRRLGSVLAAEGHPDPHHAATLIVLRGVLGLDRAALAAAWEVEEARIATCEDGGAPSPG